MSSPTSQLRKLTLESMTPRIRSTDRAGSQAPEPEELGHGDSTSDSDSDSDSSDPGHDSSIVRSPSKLSYAIGHLPETTQQTVRNTFDEPPQMALQKCRLIDDTYAFQMTELVTRSIRIKGAPDHGPSHLTCSCSVDAEPCGHLIWLLDQIARKSIYEHDLSKPLKMNASGYPEEMGDVFRHMSYYHLNILADDMHCQLVTPDSEYNDEVDPFRAEEAREMLASVHGVPPQGFRPDMFAAPSTGSKVIKRHDMDQTVFRMLLDNHHFFNYFHSLTRTTDCIRDPFHKLSQRVDHVLRDLDLDTSVVAAAASTPETPRNVAWAATHVLGVIRIVRQEIYTRDRPLAPLEAVSAARCLVHILDLVIARNRDVHSTGARRDRNLYLRLVGDRDDDFVLGVLGLIPEAASQFVHNLDAILDCLGVHGAPASYVHRFRKLISRLRASSTGSTLKRPVPGQAAGRSSKRNK